MKNRFKYISDTLLKLLVVAFIVSAFTSCMKEARPAPQVSYPDYHKQKLGASAKDLLRDDRFRSLTVELQYMTGFEPETETVGYLKAYLDSFLNKPDGIRILLKEITPVKEKMLNKDKVVAIEDHNRTAFPVNKDLTLYILTTSGMHHDKHILGMAYRNTSAVLFGGAIKKHSGGNNLLTKAELETTVLLHEIGHLLGLGNESSTSYNKRAGKGKHHHCENNKCLMYWETETRNLSVINRKGRIPQLDEICRYELQANGGRSKAFPSYDPLTVLRGF